MAYPFPYTQAAKLDARITIPRPIYDPILASALGLDSALLPEDFDLDLLRGVAKGDSDQYCSHGEYISNAETILRDKPHLQHSEYSIPGPDNNAVILSVFARPDTGYPRPALYHIHGGGMVSGDRFTAVTPVIDLLEGVGIDCVLISVEHRLSPETRAPGPAEDCYAGLVWVSENAARLGIDPASIVVFGVSGGGASAAAICLMARDRKVPAIPIKAQMLYSPLLDDQCNHLSDRQFEYGNPSNTTWIRSIWDLVLGDARGSDTITSYQVPARATDLSNLPPAYIDASECEVFRDSSVAYASKMWRGGSTCELHIWPGAWHGFDMLNNPDVPLVQMANAAKSNWFKRVMMPVMDTKG